MNGTNKEAVLTYLERKKLTVSEPEPIAEEEYARATDEFVDAVSDHPGVISVYGDSHSPTAPGISDLDFTIVVEDDREQIRKLQETVAAFMGRNPYKMQHGPCLLPEDVTEGIHLFDNFTMALRHLDGKRLDIGADENERTTSLRLFDQLAFRPYKGLFHYVFPSPMLANLNVPLAPRAVEFANAVFATRFGVQLFATDRLHIDGRILLKKMNAPRHDLNRFIDIVGREPIADTSVLQRVQEYRSAYFERETSAEDLLELALDSLRFNHELMSEYVTVQTLYPESERTYRIRKGIPALATPEWTELSVYDILSVLFESTTAGQIVPPPIAYHLATLPADERFFYDRSPESTFSSAEMESYVEKRQHLVERLIKFVDEHQIDEGPFLLPPLVKFVGDSRALADGDTLRHAWKDYKNRSVLSTWEDHI